MAITYATAVKTARLTATKDQVVNGTLELQTSANAVLATFTLSATAGTVTGTAWTLAFTATTVTATGTGTATKAVIKNSGGTAVITGLDVGTEITIDNASITSGQNVQITSATFNHAA